MKSCMIMMGMKLPETSLLTEGQPVIFGAGCVL